MAEQCAPTLVQNSQTNEWYIVTSWHKKDHPKTKYNITSQMHHVIGSAIEQFVKHVEAEAKKVEANAPPEMEEV